MRPILVLRSLGDSMSAFTLFIHLVTLCFWYVVYAGRANGSSPRSCGIKACSEPSSLFLKNT